MLKLYPNYMYAALMPPNILFRINCRMQCVSASGVQSGRANMDLLTSTCCIVCNNSVNRPIKNVEFFSHFSIIFKTTSHVTELTELVQNWHTHCHSDTGRNYYC